jgi:hypothetical protein
MPNIRPDPIRTKTSANSGRVARRKTPADFTLSRDATLSRLNTDALLTTLGQMIERNLKSGRSSNFTVEVDAKGNPTISALNGARTPGSHRTADRQSPSQDTRLDHALSAARERGHARAAEILSGDEMLSADEFAELLGVSRVTVNTRRQKHELLALEGARRGFRFPEWQVDENGKSFEVLPRLFELLGDNPWTIYRFLVQRHPALGGMTAKDALRAGRVKAVLEVAESVTDGSFA